MRSNLEDNRNWRMRIDAGLYYGTADFVPATNFQIDANMPAMLLLNPAGAINLRLPPSSGAGAAKKGQVFYLVNRSASAITVQTSAGGAFTTAIAVAANSSNRVVCTGDATAGTGWLAF